MKVNELKRKSNISKLNKSFQINHNNNKIENNKENYLTENMIKNSSFRKKTINNLKSASPIIQKKKYISFKLSKKNIYYIKKEKK